MESPPTNLPENLLDMQNEILLDSDESNQDYIYKCDNEAATKINKIDLRRNLATTSRGLANTSRYLATTLYNNTSSSENLDFSSDDNDKDPNFIAGKSSSELSLSSSNYNDDVTDDDIPNVIPTAISNLQHQNVLSLRSLPSDYSSSEYGTSPPISRKRQRNPEQWLRNVKKNLPLTDQDYLKALLKI